MISDKALVIIDVQPIFMEEPLMLTMDGNDLVTRCKKRLDRARAKDIPVVFVQHVDVSDMPEGTTQEEMAFHSELAPRAHEPMISKRFGRGFMETNLDETLKQRGVHHLIICGLSAYGCVNPTVLCASLFGYGVTVVQDAIAAPEYEQWPVTKGIRIFLAQWEKGGIPLEPATSALSAD